MPPLSTRRPPKQMQPSASIESEVSTFGLPFRLDLPENNYICMIRTLIRFRTPGILRTVLD